MISVYKQTVHDSYKVNLKELGLTFLEFNPESLDSNVQTETTDAVDGEFVTHNQFNSRKINVKLYLRATNNNDFQNKKSEIYRLFNSKQTLLIVDERLNTKKVWTVYTEGNYTINNSQTSYTNEIELTLVSESPYAQAINKTKTIINSTEGFLMNAGDVELDARHHNIQVKFYGESDKFRIVNETTDTSFQYLGKTKLSDTLHIDSLYLFINDVLITDSSLLNYGALEFAQGSNKIKIYGATGDYSLIITHRDLLI